MPIKPKIILDTALIKRREPSRDRTKSGLNKADLMSVGLSARFKYSVGSPFVPDLMSEDRSPKRYTTKNMASRAVFVPKLVTKRK